MKRVEHYIPTAIATILLVFSLAAVACTQVEQEDGEYICFHGKPLKTVFHEASKAGAGVNAIDNADKLKSASFGIYGYKAVNSDSYTGMSNVFEGSSAQQVNWDGSAWDYNPKRRWEMSMHYRFRAFWPYSAQVSASSNANRIGIEYKATTEQYDLLVAYATRYPIADPAGIGTVNMDFIHALSGLKFNVRFKRTETSQPVSDYLTGFYLKGLNTVGYLIYGQQNESDPVDKMEWILVDNTFDSSSNLFNWTGNELFRLGANAGEDLSAAAYDNDKFIFIIPQTISSSELRNTTACFFTQNGGEAVHIVDLPMTTLEAGKIYCFNLIINSNDIAVEVGVEDWNIIQSNVDINL